MNERGRCPYLKIKQLWNSCHICGASHCTGCAWPRSNCDSYITNVLLSAAEVCIGDLHRLGCTLHEGWGAPSQIVQKREQDMKSGLENTSIVSNTGLRLSLDTHRRRVNLFQKIHVWLCQGCVSIIQYLQGPTAAATSTSRFHLQ